VADPFGVLGLERRVDLTDDEVHAAWRRAAAATHPDREDGGDPLRFAEAAAAYTALRTRFARGEVLADLQARTPAPTPVRKRRRIAGRSPGDVPASGDVPAAAAGLLARVRLGRPVRLALRIVAAVAAGVIAVLAAGPHPAAPALITGVATWLAVTARRDLAPPRPGR
jgi:curved DNA-binding protein CbpA